MFGLVWFWNVWFGLVSEMFGLVLYYKYDVWFGLVWFLILDGMFGLVWFLMWF